jgi:hypothetical protein
MSEHKTLRIVAGLHEGARVTLRTGEYVLGRAEDCDIVLLDEAVAPRHARLVLDATRVRIEPIDGAPLHCKGKAVRANVKTVNDYEILSIGAAQFCLSPADESTSGASPAAPRAQAAVYANAEATGTAGRTRVTRSIYAACALLAAAALFSYAEEGWRGRAAAPASALAQARSALAAMNLIDLTASLNARGQLVISGYVNTAQDAQRVREAKSLHSLGAPLMRFHVADQLIERLRQDLDAAGVSLDYLGSGKVALRGSGTAALRPVVQRLRQDLAQVVAIEDRIHYEAPAPVRAAPNAAPLPIRIVAVHVGAISYFEDADGARYFVGGSLRDGAQVTAISETSISFSKNGQSLIHTLSESGVHANL